MVRLAPGRIAGAEMQFFIYGSPADKQPGPEALAELGKFMEESVKKGILITGGGLPVSSSSRWTPRRRPSSGSRTNDGSTATGRQSSYRSLDRREAQDFHSNLLCK